MSEREREKEREREREREVEGRRKFGVEREGEKCGIIHIFRT